ncbi:hypothetical protein [Kitasatospora terrestris]|uniref:Acyl carrier protein n=1 Tax=Kitasatospora terrestris TaxID=258051 RepID=A0ABP9DME7_9ACTN
MSDPGSTADLRSLLTAALPVAADASPTDLTIDAFDRWSLADTPVLALSVGLCVAPDPEPHPADALAGLSAVAVRRAGLAAA